MAGPRASSWSRLRGHVRSFSSVSLLLLHIYISLISISLFFILFTVFLLFRIYSNFLAFIAFIERMWGVVTFGRAADSQAKQPRSRFLDMVECWNGLLNTWWYFGSFCVFRHCFSPKAPLACFWQWPIVNPFDIYVYTHRSLKGVGASLISCRLNALFESWSLDSHWVLKLRHSCRQSLPFSPVSQSFIPPEALAFHGLKMLRVKKTSLKGCHEARINACCCLLKSETCKEAQPCRTGKMTSHYRLPAFEVHMPCKTVPINCPNGTLVLNQLSSAYVTFAPCRISQSFDMSGHGFDVFATFISSVAGHLFRLSSCILHIEMEIFQPLNSWDLDGEAMPKSRE